MGMNASTRIGPYIEVLGKLEATEKETKRECPNHPKTEQDGNKFCGKCGEPIQSVEKISKQKVYPIQVLYKSDCDSDNFFSPESMDGIIVPNINVPNEIDFDSEESGTVDLSDKNLQELMEGQIQWMQRKFDKEIFVLSKTFGESNVVVKWGVITYYS